MQVNLVFHSSINCMLNGASEKLTHSFLRICSAETSDMAHASSQHFIQLFIIAVQAAIIQCMMRMFGYDSI